VGEPTAVGGTVADEAVVMITSETGLDDCGGNNPDAKKVVFN